jgi:hypothetical protein
VAGRLLLPSSNRHNWLRLLVIEQAYWYPVPGLIMSLDVVVKAASIEQAYRSGTWFDRES